MTDGRFVWHELRAGDPDAAARFYGELLGWEFTDHPMGKTIISGGTPIGGVSAVKPGIADHWAVCVATPDVDAAAAAARAAGGIVTTGEPVDIPGMGRLAPILDSAKTIFLALTPLPGSPPAAPAPGTPGTFVWARLRTPDASAAAAFYRDVFGWTAADGVFCLPDGTHVAEVVATTEAHGWLPYVQVTSADTAHARATELGATASEPTGVPGTGRFTVITDPWGAELVLHESSR